MGARVLQGDIQSRRPVYLGEAVANTSATEQHPTAVIVAMPERKQHPPDAAINEAVLWLLRSRHLSIGERRELARWLRRSPGNVSALLLLTAVLRRPVIHRRPANWFERALTWLLPAPRVDVRSCSRQYALSLSYLEHVRKRYFRPKIALLCVAVFGVACWWVLDDLRPLNVALVAFAGFLLLIAREVVVGYRIVHGYFGNTESEVREFVKFITEHRADIDFTDRGGKRRPALVAEPRHPDSAAPAASDRSGVLPE